MLSSSLIKLLLTYDIFVSLTFIRNSFVISQYKPKITFDSIFNNMLHIKKIISNNSLITHIKCHIAWFILRLIF